MKQESKFQIGPFSYVRKSLYYCLTVTVRSRDVVLTRNSRCKREGKARERGTLAGLIETPAAAVTCAEQDIWRKDEANTPQSHFVREENRKVAIGE